MSKDRQAIFSAPPVYVDRMSQTTVNTLLPGFGVGAYQRVYDFGFGIAIVAAIRVAQIFFGFFGFIKTRLAVYQFG